MSQSHDRHIQVENKNALLELLTAGIPFIKIYIASNSFRDPKTKKIIELANHSGIPIERITRKRIDRISRTSSCESVIGIKPAPKEKSLEELLQEVRGKKKDLFLLLLNDIQYLQNIGAILRTAYGCGVDGVIISKRKSGYLTEEVTRISMGASERIPVIQMNVFDALKKLKDDGIRIVGVHMDGKPHFEETLSGDLVLVLGSEDRGISPRILSRCDTTVSIPMEAGIESLNVSAAAAVVMYEKKRQDSQKIQKLT